MELDSLINELADLASTQFPRKTKAFLKKEANKYKTATKKHARSKVKKRSGRYLEGFKAGKPYKYDGADCIRVYNGDRKAHLIEHGHRIVDKNGEEHGFKRGLEVMKEAKVAFEPKFYADTGDFVDDLLENAGLG